MITDDWAKVGPPVSGRASQWPDSRVHAPLPLQAGVQPHHKDVKST